MMAGYKLTEVGVIPDDWEVRRIADFASVGSGGTPCRVVASYWNGSIPWITTSQIDFGTINVAEQFISIEGLNNSAAKLLPVGTLLIALYGQGKTRGKVGILGIPAATNQACASITVQDGVSREFILHYLTSKYDEIRSSSNSGSQQNLSGHIVKRIAVAFPELHEQHAIASTLSDVDALLAGLDRLVAKKRDLKQAAMQQLLTGQTRLPGFQGEWAIKSIGELCSLKSGQSITAEKINDRSPYPCFGGNGLRGQTGSFTHEGAYALIGRQGALCGNVVGVEGKFFASEHALVVTAQPTVSIAWLTFVLRRMDLNQYSESSAQPGLSAAKLLLLSVWTPPSTAEQTAIAAVLSDMDAELTALLARRNKTRALKQGMMQELLTGRTRLI